MLNPPDFSLGPWVGVTLVYLNQVLHSAALAIYGLFTLKYFSDPSQYF